MRSRMEYRRYAYPIFTLTGSPPREQRVAENIRPIPIVQPSKPFDWKQYLLLGRPIRSTESYIYNIDILKPDQYLYVLNENNIPVIIAIESKSNTPLSIGYDKDELDDTHHLCWSYDESIGHYVLTTETGKRQHVPINLYIINPTKQKPFDDIIFKELGKIYKKNYNIKITKIYPEGTTQSSKKYNLPFYGNVNSIH